MVQAMARALWPRGIHVTYVVIDGVIDMPTTRSHFTDKPDTLFMRPDAIADAVAQASRLQTAAAGRRNL
jgi:hypothetical protein